MTAITNEMTTAIENLFERITDNYSKYLLHNKSYKNVYSANPKYLKNSDETVEKKAKDRFISGQRYTVGKNYIKIIINHSVWGFIVNSENDTKFRYGTVLKANSWKSPARNFSRGSIFPNSPQGQVNCNWTGV